MYFVLRIFHFGMKILIYQTQAAGVVGRGSGWQKWEVSHFSSSYPTFLPPGHVVPDCPLVHLVLLQSTILHPVPLQYLATRAPASPGGRHGPSSPPGNRLPGRVEENCRNLKDDKTHVVLGF